MVVAQSPALQPRLGLLAPMRYESVPRLDVRYWVIICAASVFGCNLGDFVSLYLHLGHWLGLMPLTAMFAALVYAERQTRRGREVWYWIVVIVLRTAATNIADLLTHTLHISYPWTIAGLEFLQVLVVLPTLPRLRPPTGDGAGRPAADLWYWASLLTAGTLGTAIGDGAAEELHLGTGLGTLVLAIPMLTFILFGARSDWSTKAGYWLALVAVRAAGTTAGDWAAFGDDGGLAHGLNLGLPVSTALSGAFFVVILLLWRSAQSVTPQD